MASDFNSVETSALSVCSSSAADCTVTVSESVPTCRAMSTRAIWPMLTGTLVRTASRKPVSEILTSYCPASTLVRLKLPSLSRDGVAGEVGFLVDDRDGCAGNVRSLCVRDRSNDAAVENLSVSGCDCDARGEQNRAGHQQPLTNGLANELTHRPPPKTNEFVPTVIARGLPDATTHPARVPRCPDCGGCVANRLIETGDRPAGVGR